MSVHAEQIRSAFDRFSSAWKTNEPAAVANFFVEDGALINPFGQRADGRAAVAALYAEYFGGMLRGTSTTFELASVRLIEANHAFVDGEQAIAAPDGTVILVVHLAALLRRDGDSWRFVESRPYVFAASPA